MNSMAAENYHLKWDSHLSFLNLSVATLFKNEKFADVMLLTSNTDGGPGIPAHRIILSSCSHFFASIFETNSSLSNGVMYIVLPPELSRRSIQILVQYMYSGEATVSNDILNEVLRGGEILKIRGLCRANNLNQTNINNNNNNNNQPNDLSLNHYSMNITKSDISHKFQTQRSDHDRQPELHGLGASATAIPKESPVIVRSPQPPQQIQPIPLSNPSSTTSNLHNITIKKDSIDPNDINCGSSHFGRLPIQIASGVKNLQTNHENISKNYPSFSDRMVTVERDRSRRHSEDITNLPRQLTKEEMLRRISKEEELSQRIDRRRLSLPEIKNQIQDDITRQHIRICTIDRSCEDDIPEPLNFLTIKQEPTDCQPEHDHDLMSPMRLPNLDVIKSESNYSGEDDRHTDREEEEDLVYSPLTCELCSETFTVPADWVRHIESHMDSSAQYLPKKRRKLSGSSTDYIASLKCDLCATYFVTPAEWVRHIHNTHTETELAISNKSALPKRSLFLS